MTVELSTKHDLPCSPEEFWRIYWDANFRQKLCEVANLREYRVLSQKEDELHRTESVFIAPAREFPPAVRRVLKSATAAFVEDRRWVKSESCLYWTVRPQALEDRSRCQGTLQAVSTPTGCQRVLKGEISVRMLGIGSLIERLISRNVTDSFDLSAKLIASWRS